MKMKNLLMGLSVVAAAGTAVQGAGFSTYNADVDDANGLRNSLNVSVVGQAGGGDKRNYRGYIGAFVMRHESNPTWYSFCTDLSATLQGTYQYAEMPVTPSAPSLNLGTPRWDRGGMQSAAAIYKAHVGGMKGVTGADRKAYGAALQLAIWEALYDTELTPGTAVPYGLGGGNFIASGLDGTVATYFKTFMGAAGGCYAGVNWLEPKEHGGSQGGFRRVAVPEPATLLTSVLALGLGWLGRRRLV